MVEGRGSRVEGKWSRVEKLFKIIFKLFFNFVSSKVHRLVFTGVSGASCCRIWVVLSIRIWPFLFLRLNCFFSGPQIQIKAEDNAYAEDAVTYRCHTQVLKQYCLFRAETQWFFLSNDSLGYEKIRQKNPQYQYQYRYQWITIED